jgi:NADPH-dependent glutamate synthase beta subunit-like oxidoreductase
MKLGAVDSSGRQRPEPIEGSEFSLDFDTVIAAIGQMPDVPAQMGVGVDRGNVIRVDPDTLATDREGVFAGGDAVSGPASIIEAIAAGGQAAISIDKYLGGNGIIDEVLAPPEGEMALPGVEEGERHRIQMPCLSLSERAMSFAEVELGFDKEMAVEEAKRCLRCDLELR